MGEGWADILRVGWVRLMGERCGMGRSVWKGFATGVLGGVAGTVVLNVFQPVSLKGTRAVERRVGDGERYAGEQKELLDTFTEAHAKTAQVGVGAVGGRLAKGDARRMAPAVEFLFGAVCGGVYGALAEYVSAVTAGFGTAYGAVLFTEASEVVLPALGWVPTPGERTPVQHLGGLAGNVVYGATTEAVRRLVRGE